MPCSFALPNSRLEKSAASTCAPSSTTLLRTADIGPAAWMESTPARIVIHRGAHEPTMPWSFMCSQPPPCMSTGKHALPTPPQSPSRLAPDFSPCQSLGKEASRFLCPALGPRPPRSQSAYSLPRSVPVLANAFGFSGRRSCACKLPKQPIHSLYICTPLRHHAG